MRQCLTLLISIVVLLSTTGVPHVQHLCGGIVQSAGLWIGSAGCDHEVVSYSSCSSHALAKSELPDATAASCCKKPTATSAEEKKDCCTNQVEWEPSNLDLAFGDQLILEGQVTFVFPIHNTAARLIPTALEICPNVRPPPLIPLAQSKRRALLQVYSC